MPASFEGKNSTQDYEAETICPKCKRKGVYYIGSEVLNGNPYSPAADTEVNHYYRCAHADCKHEWTEYV